MQYFTRFIQLVILFAFIGFASSCGEEEPMPPVEETLECDSLQLTIDHNLEEESLSVFVTGGAEPYSYSWLDGDSTATIGLSDYVSFYSVTVTDAEGCEKDAEYEIEIDSCESFYVQIHWFYEGDAGVEARDGVEPYSYQWSTGSVAEWIVISEPGTYSCTVVDALGCSKTDDITLSAFDIDPCIEWTELFYWDANNGILSFGTGTDELLYEWSGGETSNSISVSETGQYSTTVSYAILHGEELCPEKTFSTYVVVDDPNLACNQMNISAATATPLDFAADSEAYLFTEMCSYGPYDHAYVIAEANWDFSGHYYPISAAWSGIPGLTFGSTGAPVVGQTYAQYSLGNHETLFAHRDRNCTFWMMYR